uniref:Protein kinase C-binding protein 1 n=1 Tax=Lygus hesperus TaxID=30085 RepID=A0A0A9X656_LYGHE
MVAAPVNEKDPVKSSRMKTTTIVFKHPSTSEKLLGEKSVKNVETLARQRSSLEDRGSDGLVKEKSSCPSMGREEELASKKPCESADKGKCKAINSTTNEADNNFLTITSTMSLRPLPQVDPSASTSARTQPITRTLKPSHLKDLAASAKRKIADASKTPVKKPRVKEVGKDAIASGMPRPIIIKVEPEDQVHEIKDSPPPLTSKAAAGPIKPSIKVVHLSNLMERPPPGVINRFCPSPQNNMIPPFKPKKDMSDVRALIEAKKQFISAKLKADIYEMLDQIKAEYESHIDLLTSVSDRQLQNFESTFETDKIQLYEDFKNKLRDQMDQQITEIKRKQWCANCGAEASFHCCWNHAYCGDKCQKEDWSTHSQNCTQYSMSATDPYIRSSPRFRALLENQSASGAARKISLQDLIDVPVAVSVQNSPPKAQAKKPKKMLGSTPAYSGVPTISIPECELPELPRPPPSAKSFLTAPVQRLNNGEQISFDNGKRAYRIIQQNPGGPKTLKVVGQSTPTRNPTAINSYSGPVMRLGSQGRSFALVVGGDNNAKKPNQTVTYGALRKSIVTPPSSSGQQVNKTQTVTIAKRVGNQISVVKKTPSVRVMEDNELASILARNHLRDTYVHASS